MRGLHDWRVHGVLTLVAAFALAGCYKGNYLNCAVSCESATDCPGDLGCSPQGLCSVGGASCEGMIPMPDADLTKPQPVTVMTSGDGTVASAPSGINCGSTCEANFPPLSSVTLTATPGPNALLDSWTGDCASSTTNECTLTLDGPKATTARFAQHGAKRWVKQVSFSGDDFRDGGIATDADGNVVAVGNIDEGGTKQIYAIKYSRTDGATIWEKKIPMTDVSTDIAGADVDAAGNVYFCARLQGFGPGMVGTTAVSGDLSGNILAVRLAAADGAVEWVKQWGGGGQDICRGIVVSGTDVFVTGNTSSNPSAFDTVSLTGSSNAGFLVKASTTTGVATRGVILTGNYDMRAIAKNNGKVAIGGTTAAASTIDANCSTSATGMGRGFIAAFDNNLNCSFVKKFTSSASTPTSSTYGIVGAPNGDWIATGAFQGTTLFADSGTSIPHLGMSDAFIARYSSTGTHIYSFGYGTADNEVGRSLAVTSTGELVLVGEFSVSVTFGSTTLTGTNDIFLTRLSAGPAPIHEWAQKIGGNAYELAKNLALGPDGTVNVSAYWTGMSDVLGTPLTAQAYDGWTASFVR